MSENMDKMIDKIKNNSAEENKKLAQELKNGLSDKQAEALNKLMSDSSLIKKLLESDKVNEIMKKIGGDKNGHQ